MTAAGYDIVTVGGGVGGASFARGMAASGRRVLVLERETQFKDRVRGEWLSPWGVEETRLLAGVLLDDLDIDEEIGIFSIGRPGALAAIFPQGNKRARAYVLLQQEEPARLKGDGGLERFIGISVEAGVAPSVFASCRAVGPLVSFVADDSWIERPYVAGVVLIGDAAGVSDPTLGDGSPPHFPRRSDPAGLPRRIG